MAQQFNPGKTRQSRIPPPPIDADLFEQPGVIAYVWQRWLFSVFQAGSTAYDVEVKQAFGRGPAGDPLPAIDREARLLGGGEHPGRPLGPIADLERLALAATCDRPGRFAAEIQDLYRRIASIDTPDRRWLAELEALRATLAGLTQRYGQWRSDIDALYALVAVQKNPRPPDPASTVVQIRQTITADTTIADPGGLVPATAEVEYQLTYDGVGGWVVSWASVFKGVSSLTVGRTASLINMVRFRRISSTQLIFLFSAAEITP